VDYGQAAAASEARASAAVAAYFGVPNKKVDCRSRSFGAGEIRGRNAFLAHLALMAFPGETGVVVLGIHAGTGYRDCDIAFVKLIQQSYDFHTGGQIALAAPFVSQSKGDVVHLAFSLGLPLDLTYSCEAGNVPCGVCRSCGDREAFVARP
jgi:7-cyano-7-deazaguanine synthase